MTKTKLLFLFDLQCVIKLLFLLIVLLPVKNGIANEMSAMQIKAQPEFALEQADFCLQSIPYKIRIYARNDAAENQLSDVEAQMWVNGVRHDIRSDEEGYYVQLSSERNETLKCKMGTTVSTIRVNVIPLFLSIIPPLLAILIALLFKEVFTALLVGIFCGTLIMHLFSDQHTVAAIFNALFDIIDTYIVQSLTDSVHISIIVFSMLIGAMVSLITRNGGMRGVVNILSRHASNPRSGQFITWLLGIALFFDDYANTLVVGNTMRPVTDKLRISREKLSYIVDSTAAPIAAIAFVTTWIGAELSYIQKGATAIGLTQGPYQIFFQSLQYSFYPVFALLFVLLLIFQRRDFGPMLNAEKRCRKDASYNNRHDQLTPEKDNDSETYAKERWINAVLPVVTVIVGTIAGLIYTGIQEVGWNTELSFASRLSKVIGSADSFVALLWASFAGVIVAVFLTVSQRILNLKQSVEALISGLKTMLTAILILVLAWSLAMITEHLHTADFISNFMIDIQLSPHFVPALTFIMAALVAFSTGSSWGTMAILYPLILPAAWLISEKSGLSEEASYYIFYNVVSCVLAGSVFGDHCSPISDTTILSSLASSCNHIEHVRTQLPYAIVVGGVSIIIGTIPAAFGIKSYILFPLGIIIIFLIIRFFGKRYND